MTWIKICGTTNLEDALLSVQAGADALGFVFYKRSARHVEAESVRKIVDHLPQSVEKVGVFVNEPMEVMEEVASKAGLTALQIYGANLTEPETRETLKKFAAVREEEFAELREQLRVLTAPARSWDAIFVDSGTTQQPGGTGKRFDWQKSQPMAEEIGRAGLRLVVAGGLNAGNVNDAIRILKPWGVDVVSGVEASPGKKDAGKVRAFINAVRRGDK